MSLIDLWANRAMLDQAGVDPASLATWDGLLAAVQRLRAAGINPIGVGGADRWPLQGYWTGIALALGGRDALEAALAGKGAGFEAETFLEAGVRLKELTALDPFQQTYRDLTAVEARRAFIGGWTAMTATGDWAHTEMSRNWPGGPEAAARDLIRIPFPPTGLGPGTERLTLGGSDALVLREAAPASALDLLDRLSSLETQTALARMGFAVPSIAGADAAITVPALRAVADDLTRTDHHQLFLDQVFGPQAGEALNDAVVALVDGDLTPDRAAAEIERAWAEVRVDSLPEPPANAPEPAPALVPAE
jgi:raffinose/stachyose/melibiose transport system substrate-binding protein